MLLELAIWKAKITDQYESHNNTFTIDMKMRYRTDSVMMVTIIVPNVLSFLTDGNDCDDAFDSNNEDSDDNYGNDEEDIDESSDEDDNDDDDEQDDYNDGNEDEDGDGEDNRRQRRRLG